VALRTVLSGFTEWPENGQTSEMPSILWHGRVRGILSGKEDAVGTDLFVRFEKHKNEFSLRIIFTHHSHDICIADLIDLLSGHIVHWVASIWRWLHGDINDNRSGSLGSQPLLGSWSKDMQVLCNPR